jgi:hypothetical protein
MHVLSHILADPLASDHMWLAVVFLAVLAILAGFRVAGGHTGKRRRRRLQRAVR